MTPERIIDRMNDDRIDRDLAEQDAHEAYQEAVAARADELMVEGAEYDPYAAHNFASAMYNAPPDLLDSLIQQLLYLRMSKPVDELLQLSFDFWRFHSFNQARNEFAKDQKQSQRERFEP